jgi:hypothetical protein
MSDLSCQWHNFARCFLNPPMEISFSSLSLTFSEHSMSDLTDVLFNAAAIPGNANRSTELHRFWSFD